MLCIGMVVMQKFGGSAICPGYNARKYEKRRGERIEKPRVESERYYTSPSVQSVVVVASSVAKDSPVNDRMHERRTKQK